MMVQLQKIIRDLWIYRLRTGLSIFAITVGLTLFGAIGTARDTLKTSYEQAFRTARPAQIAIQIPAFEYGLLRRIEMIEQIETLSAHFVTSAARIRVSENEWLPLELHGGDDFMNLSLHRVFAEPPIMSYTPTQGTIWLDRSILQRNDVAIGDEVEIQTSSGEKHILQISGFVNDTIAYPSHLSDQAVAYVSSHTLKDLHLAIYLRPGQPTFNQLFLRTDMPTRDVLGIRNLMQDVEEEIKQAGYTVVSVEYLSDAPPLEAQTSVLDTLLILSTVFTFIVTGVMIGNFVSAVIGRQVSEIGIMKSLGAVPSQITTLFFMMMILIGLIAFVLSIPLTGYASQVLSEFLVSLIDIDAGSVLVTSEIRVLQFIAAILFPIVASILPIVQGSTLTVRETLRSDGNVKSRWVKNLSLLPRLLLPNMIFQMAFLNTFLKPGRFLLTALSLTLPGALFMSSFGIETALRDLDTSLASSLFDYEIELNFNGYEAIPRLIRLAEKQDNVQYVEAWRQSSIFRVYNLGADFSNRLQNQNLDDTSRPPPQNSEIGRPPPPPNGANGRPPPPRDGTNGRPPPPPNQVSGSTRSPSRIAPNTGVSVSGNIALRGVPINSQILGFPREQLLLGTWLNGDNQLLLTYEAYEAVSLNVDQSSTIEVGHAQDSAQWDVVGITGQMLMTEGIVSIDTFERLIPAWASSIRLAVRTNSKNPNDVLVTLENLRTIYHREDISVNSSISIQGFIERRSERLSIVTQTLILISVLIGGVSVIGLISTISINTRERTKSIGILRSLGGDYRHLGAMVMIESLTIVLISYILAFFLSDVFGHEISGILGEQMFSLEASYQLEMIGCVIWFFVMVVVGIFAALGPAFYAINITISDTLRYEG